MGGQRRIKSPTKGQSVEAVSATDNTTEVATPSTGVSKPDTQKKLFVSGINARELRRKLMETAHDQSVSEEHLWDSLDVRRGFILRLITCFMLYGAPSHRIEAYFYHLIAMLDLEGEFHYTFGCATVSFMDPSGPDNRFKMTAFTTLVKGHGLCIGACEDTFIIYKKVMHGQMSVHDGFNELGPMMTAGREQELYSKLFLIVYYGFTSALLCVWAFGGWWLDMVPSFLLGSFAGFLQIIVANKNVLFLHFMEVPTVGIIYFLAHAWASIGHEHPYFCFSAIAQASIASILPGYSVLCGTLELQSKLITAGSTRLFYTIYYTLMLNTSMGFGNGI